jgi:peptidoglycan/LPS O-acetylase OafA/YrhL
MANKGWVPGLDIIRFVAAMMVMFVHLCTSSWAHKGSPTFEIVAGHAAYPELLGVTWFGWIGVEVFFVISGLVIAHSAENAAAATFACSRVLRLYPAAWVCATLTAITLIVTGYKDISSVEQSWLRSVSLYPKGPWVDPVYWTLGVEMAFYLIIFLLLLIKGFRYLEPVVLFMGFISSLYWVAGAIFVPEFLRQHLWTWWLNISLIAYGCYFATGTMIYIISRNQPTIFRLTALAFFISAAFVEISFAANEFNKEFFSHEPVFVPQCAFFFAVTMMLLSTRTAVGSSGWIAKSVRLIGLSTYPLYLLHQIVGASIMSFILLNGGRRYFALISSLICCILASVVIAKLIEPRIRSLLRMFITWVAALPLWPRVAGLTPFP